MARKRPKRLTRLRINEASLVDVPANVGAEILLWKRAGEEVTKRTATDHDLATIDRNLALLRSDLAALLEEPASARAALVKDAVAAFVEDLMMELPEEQEEPGMDTRTDTSELDRMLAYSKAGGTVHSWSDQDVHEAMTSLALRLSPDLPAETALQKNFGNREMQQLYSLYRSAEAAPVEEPVEKMVDTKSWCKIKQAVADFRATPEGQHLSEPAALSVVLDRNPELYTAYRAETDQRDLND